MTVPRSSGRDPRVFRGEVERQGPPAAESRHAQPIRPRPRLLLGVVGGGAYVADTVSTAGAKPVMVNWDVVAKNLDSVTTLAREGWKKIAG